MTVYRIHRTGLPKGPNRIHPPWSREVVEKLNKWQKDPMIHPMTCPGDYEACDGNRKLVATRDGWVCRCGRYKQRWAWGAMVEKENADQT